MAFNRNEIDCFTFETVSFDPKTSSASLHYSLGKNYHFTERFTFHGATAPQSAEGIAALDQALKNLHLIAGVSYYKAAVPKKIECRYPITKRAAEVFNSLYLKGLGEFAFRNNIEINELISIPYEEKLVDMPSTIDLPRRTVVPVGGGKDSVVTIEALRNAGEPIAAFVLGDNQTIHRVASLSGVPVIHVSRQLSPLLIEINQQGALNGHVPISAILSFVLVAASILYGFDAIAMSYEQSANSPTLERNGIAVNHQFSKSFECEKLIHEYIRDALLANLNYFSFIRPLSELSVASLFARCASYHREFTSCNAHFRISTGARERWCNNCPKCRFVFLALAPFLSKSNLISIFGRNLLDDPNQLPGYLELLGAEGHKPFECVGEEGEVRQAFTLLRKMTEWKDDYIVKQSGAARLSDAVELDLDYLTEFSSQHLLQPHYSEILHAFMRS